MPRSQTECEHYLDVEMPDRFIPGGLVNDP